MGGSDPIMTTVLAMLVLGVVVVVGLLVLTVLGAPAWIKFVALVAALLIAALIGAHGLISTPGRKRHDDRESE